jgi:hypothetical protein
MINIDGHFAGCSFCRLSDEDRVFALAFLQMEGSIKDMERLMGISYPTVKAKLARLNAALSGETNGYRDPVESISAKNTSLGPDERARIIDRLKSGEIDAREAASLLRGKSSESSDKTNKGKDNER